MTASELDPLADLLSIAAETNLPPVHLWKPSHCGEIDIRIRQDGVWLHQGTPIARERLVRLFSTILRRDPDGFHLVTPVEKLKIVVDDAPFVAVRLDRCEAALRFTTNVGDTVDASGANPIRIEFDAATGEPRPYVHVRRGLEAKLSRPVFYDLVEDAVSSEDGVGVWSGGAWFALDHPEDR